MKINKLLLAAVLVVSLVIIPACASTPPAAGSSAASQSAAAAEWSLEIEGVDGKTAFTSADAAGLEVLTLDMTVTNKNGESKTNAYTGVRLKDILAAMGVDSVSALTVTASDDFSADYTAELAMDDNTILAWERDGEALEAPTMCPQNGTGNQFVKNTVKLVITR